MAIAVFFNAGRLLDAALLGMGKVLQRTHPGDARRHTGVIGLEGAIVAIRRAAAASSLSVGPHGHRER